MIELVPAVDENKWIVNDKTTNFSKVNKEIVELMVHILGK